MKENDKKHDHKGTKILKVLLFSLIMFMPMISVFTETITNIAKPTTNTEIIYKYETNEVNNENDIKEGRIYHVNLANAPKNDNWLFTAKAIYNFNTEYTKKD